MNLEQLQIIERGLVIIVFYVAIASVIATVSAQILKYLELRIRYSFYRDSMFKSTKRVIIPKEAKEEGLFQEDKPEPAIYENALKAARKMAKSNLSTTKYVFDYIKNNSKADLPFKQLSKEENEKVLEIAILERENTMNLLSKKQDLKLSNA